MGDDPIQRRHAAGRELILRLGGAEGCNSFTKFYFAALGQISYDACPSIPPEIVLLPKWFYFNLYHVSAWTRTMILPLSLGHHAPSGARASGQIRASANCISTMPRQIGWARPGECRRTCATCFLRVDQLLKIYEHAPLQALRKHAMAEAESWLLEHLDDSEGLGAIFPPMVYILIVFLCAGISGRSSAGSEAHKPICAISSSMKTTQFGSSRVFPRCGTRASRCTHWPRRICRPTRMRLRGQRTGCWKRNAASHPTGRRIARASNPPDGFSNLRIHTIPMSMTPRWCTHGAAPARWRTGRAPRSSAA